MIGLPNSFHVSLSELTHVLVGLYLSLSHKQIDQILQNRNRWNSNVEKHIAKRRGRAKMLRDEKGVRQVHHSATKGQIYLLLVWLIHLLLMYMAVRMPVRVLLVALVRQDAKIVISSQHNPIKTRKGMCHCLFYWQRGK